MSEYKAVKVSKGSGGWGGPLTIKPEGKRKYIASITGGVSSEPERVSTVTPLRSPRWRASSSRDSGTFAWSMGSARTSSPIR